METIQYLKNKFGLDLTQKMPIQLPIDRFRGLCGLFHELGYKIGAEIGVSCGFYSKWLVQKNRGLKLYCIDSWIAYDEYTELHGKEGQTVCDACYKKCLERLKSFPNCIIIKKTSMEAVKDFKDESLDFVFIDANHSFRYVTDDIDEWSKKVRKGGIISGHDFWRSIEQKKVWAEVRNRTEKMKLCQVKDAVIGWTAANEISPWFITNDNKGPSWFWVKQ